MQKTQPPSGRYRQIELDIASRLHYHPEKFVEHAGVAPIRKSLLHLLGQEHYPVVSIVGTKRSGKTHLSHFLAHGLKEAAHRFTPSLAVESFQGKEFLQMIYEGEFPSSDTEKRCILIDDADEMLLQFAKGNSGPLVKCIEDLRVVGGIIVFFRNDTVHEYGFDDHLLTRFAAGTEFLLGDPDRSELIALLQALSEQRGWRLNNRMVAFLEKRLRIRVRDIESYLERVQLLSRLRSDRVNFSLLGDAL